MTGSLQFADIWMEGNGGVRDYTAPAPRIMAAMVLRGTAP